jgi:tRNA U38,U39,U40 pseudouridine synthase TruA
MIIGLTLIAIKYNLMIIMENSFLKNIIRFLIVILILVLQAKLSLFIIAHINLLRIYKIAIIPLCYKKVTTMIYSIEYI